MLADMPSTPPNIRAAREAIKRTVERVTTPDRTKLPTPAELEELKKQKAEARDLARNSDTKELRYRIKETVERATKTGKHAIMPRPPERAVSDDRA
jgi:hypothetical protein